MGEAKNSFICLIKVVSEFIILRSCRRATYRTSVDREIPCSLPGSSATTEKPAPSSLGRPLLGEDRPLLPGLLLRLGGILRRNAGDFPLWFHRRCCTQPDETRSLIMFDEDDPETYEAFSESMRQFLSNPHLEPSDVSYFQGQDADKFRNCSDDSEIA